MPALVGVTATRKAFDGAPRVRLSAAYTRALEDAGVIPIVLAPLEPSAAPAVIARVDGLVLTGGEDVDPARFGEPRHRALGEVVPVRDAWELSLVAAARSRRLPTLAICRGIQLLAVAAGGTLIQDLPSQHPSEVDHDPKLPRDARAHAVRVEAGSRLAAALGGTQLRVNSFHHQAVREPGAGFRASAWAPDGVIEGMESTDPAWWALGVQWHPEELAEAAEPWERGLFAAFASQMPV
ncbi:MAG: gamma-glutamyl-gamma-aminobutyrate hydrolase family protein [Gemmatimonadaceae bacterium]